MRLDEPSLRRPDFQGGIPILLADGQAWTFACPIVRLVPTDDDAGFETYARVKDRPDESERFTSLIQQRDVLLAREDGVTVAEIAPVEMALGKILLLANYDLTGAQVKRLLQFSYRDDDEEGAGIRKAVMDVVLGVGPKPSAGGDESPSSPTA